MSSETIRIYEYISKILHDLNEDPTFDLLEKVPAYDVNNIMTDEVNDLKIKNNENETILLQPTVAEWLIDYKKNSRTVYHRFGKPAFIEIYSSTHYDIEWVTNGKMIANCIDGKFSGNYYDWAVENKIDMFEPSDEDMVLIKLVWG